MPGEQLQNSTLTPITEWGRVHTLFETLQTVAQETRTLYTHPHSTRMLVFPPYAPFVPVRAAVPPTVRSNAQLTTEIHGIICKATSASSSSSYFFFKALLFLHHFSRNLLHILSLNISHTRLKANKARTETVA